MKHKKDVKTRNVILFIKINFLKWYVVIINSDKSGLENRLKY